jgi:hypothetical protein
MFMMILLSFAIDKSAHSICISRHVRPRPHAVISRAGQGLGAGNGASAGIAGCSAAPWITASGRNSSPGE